MPDLGKRLILDAGGMMNRPPLEDPCGCLREFLEVDSERDAGRVYYEYEPRTPRDVFLPEDVAISLTLNSRASGLAVASVVKNGHTIDLRTLPDKPLQETSCPERDQVAELLAKVCKWPHFKASTVTKILHKKRPALIPVLDNLAIFGAYLNPDWPNLEPSADSIGDKGSIQKALDCIAADLVRPENAGIWPTLQAVAPKRTLIEVFDMVWWIYFKRREKRRKKQRREDTKKS